MILRHDVTVGHVPVTIFAVMVAVIACVCMGFLVHVNAHPPTILHRDSLGLSMVPPARYDLAYHEAVGRRFLNLYGNYNPHTYLAKSWWASRLAEPVLADHLFHLARRFEESVTIFSISRQLLIVGHAVEWEDETQGQSVHAFEVEMVDYYGSAEHERQRGWYLIEIHEIAPREGALLSAEIRTVAFYPKSQEEAAGAAEEQP